MDAPSLEELTAQGDALLLDRFDYEAAWAIGTSIREVAAARSLPIAIEVFHVSTPVFLALMPGATADNVDWVRRKRNVAMRFDQSSLYMRLTCASKNVEFHKKFRLPEADYAASGGSVPIRIRGVGIVGAVSVSGLPDVEDHQLVAAQLAKMLRD